MPDCRSGFSREQEERPAAAGLRCTARTTPRLRAELQAAKEGHPHPGRPLRLNPETVTKWQAHHHRRRPDGPAKPHSTTLTEAEEAVVVEFGRRTLLLLDDVLGCLGQPQPDGGGAALLLQRDAGTPGELGADRLRPKAAPAAFGVEHGRGGVLPRGDAGTVQRATPTTAYAAGLWVFEVVALKIPDIDRRADADPGRAGQGRQGPLRAAVPQPRRAANRALRAACSLPLGLLCGGLQQTRRRAHPAPQLRHPLTGGHFQRQMRF